MVPKHASLTGLPPAERFPALKCPACSSLLRTLPAHVSCGACTYRLALSDGIISAPTDPFYYDHRIPEENFESFLQQAGSLGWARAFYQLQRSRPRDREMLFTDCADPAKAGWKFLLPLSGGAQTLVLGAGSEAVPISFSASSETVIAVDACRKRLESLRYQMRSRRIENITLIHGSDVDKLPLSAAYFDLVLIHDLQDWLPQLSAKSRQMPISFLKAVKRLLKPQGALYVAGENRFTYSGVFQSRYSSQSVWEVEARHGFIGSASGRAAAGVDNGHSKRGRSSSTSSHSYRGYQRRLREAGMLPSAVYAPVPDHRTPTEVVELTASTGRSGAPAVLGLSSLLKTRIRCDPRFLRTFGHSYALVSSPHERAQPAFIYRVFSELRTKLHAELIQLDDYVIGKTEVTIGCTLRWQQAAQTPEQTVAIRLPLGRPERQLLLRNGRALVRLSELRLEPALTGLIPSVLLCQEVAGQQVIVERRLRGDSFEDVFGHWSRDRICLAVEEIVQLLARNSASKQLPWKQSGKRRFDQMCVETSHALIDPSVRKGFERLCGRLGEKLRSVVMPGILTHGDLRLCSVIVDGDQGQLRQLLNWGAMTEYGLPGWDLIALESSVVQFSRQCGLGESVVWLSENGYAQGFMPVWKTYELQTGFSESLRQAALLSFWIRSVWQQFRQPLAPLNYEWVRNNVITVLERINRNP